MDQSGQLESSFDCEIQASIDSLNKLTEINAQRWEIISTMLTNSPTLYVITERQKSGIVRILNICLTMLKDVVKVNHTYTNPDQHLDVAEEVVIHEQVREELVDESDMMDIDDDEWKPEVEHFSTKSDNSRGLRKPKGAGGNTRIKTLLPPQLLSSSSNKLTSISVKKSGTTRKRKAEEPVNISESDSVFRLRRERLKGLLLQAHKWSLDEVTAKGFNPLGTLQPLDFGLNNIYWHYEILALLLLCPEFEFKDNMEFLRGLILVKLMEKKSTTAAPFFKFMMIQIKEITDTIGSNVEKGVSKQFNQTYGTSRRRWQFGQTEIYKELKEKGFGPFNPMLEGKVEVPDAAPEQLSEGGLRNNLTNWLVNESSDQKLQVLLGLPIAYTAFKSACQMNDIIKTEHLAGLIGYRATDDPMTYRAKLLLEPAVSENFNGHRFLSNFSYVLKDICGFTHEEVFMATCVNEGYKMFHKQVLRRKVEVREKIDVTDKEEVMLRLTQSTAEMEELRAEVKPVQLLSFPQRSFSKLNINFDSSLTLPEIEGLCLIFGTNTETCAIRNLVDHETLCKIRAKSVNASKAEENERQRAVRSMYYIAAHLVEEPVNELHKKLPSFKDEYMRVHWLVIRNNFLKTASETTETVTCPHCGIALTSVLNSLSCHAKISTHIKKCKMETGICDCNIDFKNTQSKRRHMKLRHSGLKYLECDQCTMLFRREQHLKDHVAYMHGTGKESFTCDLCPRNFKCPNHLRIHKFSHELYYCTDCRIEILTRNKYNNHMKRMHDAGFNCDICGKHIMTQKELNIHIKKQHQDPVMLNMAM